MTRPVGRLGMAGSDPCADGVGVEQPHDRVGRDRTGELHDDEHRHGARSDGRLPRVDELAPGDAPRGDVDVGVAADDGRALAAELERHRGEVLGGGVHHDPGNGAVARVDDVVEALRQELRGLGDATLDELDRGLGQVGDERNVQLQSTDPEEGHLVDHLPDLVGDQEAGGEHYQVLGPTPPNGEADALGTLDQRIGDQHQPESRLSLEEADVDEQPVDQPEDEVGVRRQQQVLLGVGRPLVEEPSPSQDDEAQAGGDEDDRLDNPLDDDQPDQDVLRLALPAELDPEAGQDVPAGWLGGGYCSRCSRNRITWQAANLST